MTFIVVDASIWVARLVPQDIFYTNVKTWFDTQSKLETIFLSPGLMLAEVAGAISRRTGQQQLGLQVITNLQQLSNLQLVEMDNRLMIDSARLAARLGLRGADSVYVAVAMRLNIPLATLDQDQKEKSASIIPICDL